MSDDLRYHNAELQSEAMIGFIDTTVDGSRPYKIFLPF